MTITAETLYLRLFDEMKKREFLETRIDVLEHFIKMKYPNEFAGDADTITDPELKAINIVYGEPQESYLQEKRLNGEER